MPAGASKDAAHRSPPAETGKTPPGARRPSLKLDDFPEHPKRKAEAQGTPPLEPGDKLGDDGVKHPAQRAKRHRAALPKAPDSPSPQPGDATARRIESHLGENLGAEMPAEIRPVVFSTLLEELVGHEERLEPDHMAALLAAATQPPTTHHQAMAAVAVLAEAAADATEPAHHPEVMWMLYETMQRLNLHPDTPGWNQRESARAAVRDAMGRIGSPLAWSSWEQALDARRNRLSGRAGWSAHTAMSLRLVRLRAPGLDAAVDALVDRWGSPESATDVLLKLSTHLVDDPGAEAEAAELIREGVRKIDPAQLPETARWLDRDLRLAVHAALLQALAPALNAEAIFRALHRLSQAPGMLGEDARFALLQSLIGAARPMIPRQRMELINQVVVDLSSMPTSDASFESRWHAVLGDAVEAVRASHADAAHVSASGLPAELESMLQAMAEDRPEVKPLLLSAEERAKLERRAAKERAKREKGEEIAMTLRDFTATKNPDLMAMVVDEVLPQIENGQLARIALDLVLPELGVALAGLGFDAMRTRARRLMPSGEGEVFDERRRQFGLLIGGIEMTDEPAAERLLDALAPQLGPESSAFDHAVRAALGVVAGQLRMKFGLADAASPDVQARCDRLRDFIAHTDGQGLADELDELRIGAPNGPPQVVRELVLQRLGGLLSGLDDFDQKEIAMATISARLRPTLADFHLNDWRDTIELIMNGMNGEDMERLMSHLWQCVKDADAPVRGALHELADANDVIMPDEAFSDAASDRVEYAYDNQEGY
ncbi:MAG: hypothetical protein ABW032_01375 [Burkholderiaceae bacterium]